MVGRVASMSDERGPFDARDFDQRFGDHGAGNSMPRLVGRTDVAERRRDAATGELFPRVEHVRAYRTGRQRSPTNSFEFRRLAEVERHRDHLGVAFHRQPRNGGEVIAGT